MRKLIVVNNPKEWNFAIENVEVVAAKNYLLDPEYATAKQVQVFNLCRRYSYQSTGYYVSLLAEARGHRAIPSVTTMNDFKSRNLVRSISDDIDELIQKSLKHLKGPEFTLSIYFGRNVSEKYDKLARALYNLFQSPLLRAHFIHNSQSEWMLDHIQPIPFQMISEEHKPFVEEFARAYFALKRYPANRQQRYDYDLAILVNPEESDPPSNKKALQNFREAAEALDFSVDFVTKDDYSRISEYDALFIRETTRVNHHTYLFARKAESEGLVVLDDAESILRCTNKVYLAELLNRAHVRTPKTLIIHKESRGDNLISQLGLPVVLKKPDGSFSKGVRKCKSEEELARTLDEMFEESDLLLAQEFMPTDFDWRIGLLNDKVLFACKYYMAKGHWQIFNWAAGGNDQVGAYECVPLSKVPSYVMHTAMKAAHQIGKGLYGVDLKEVDKKAYVIEVNDNPNVDADIEDLLLGPELYLNIMRTFKERLEEKT
jgi:glutathione synthase/RimK-type ligase-like ATP-grasp enzyme